MLACNRNRLSNSFSWYFSSMRERWVQRTRSTSKEIITLVHLYSRYSRIRRCDHSSHSSVHTNRLYLNQHGMGFHRSFSHPFGRCPLSDAFYLEYEIVFVEINVFLRLHLHKNRRPWDLPDTSLAIEILGSEKEEKTLGTFLVNPILFFRLILEKGKNSQANRSESCHLIIRSSNTMGLIFHVLVCLLDFQKPIENHLVEDNHPLAVGHHRRRHVVDCHLVFDFVDHYFLVRRHSVMI